MSIHIRIDGMKLPEKDKDLPVMIDHEGRVCVGAKIVGRAEYLPSNADSVRAMSDEDLAWLYATKHAGCYGCDSTTMEDCRKCALEWLQRDAEGEA